MQTDTSGEKIAFDPEEITAMCKAFLDNISLDCGVYASYSWFTEYIDWRSLGCAVWNAQWGRNDDFKGYNGSILIA